MIGTVLDLRSIAFGPNDELPYALFLPTYAATAWHYNKINRNQSSSLNSYVDKVEKFAINKYLPALVKGSHLSDTERSAIVNKLSQYIGLSKKFIKRANLRIKPSVFRKRILRGENKVVGRYDTRYNAADLNPISNRAQVGAFGRDMGAALSVMFQKYLHEDLKFGKGRTYMGGAGWPNFRWKWGFNGRFGGNDGSFWPVSPNTAPRLARAMNSDPDLKVQVFDGYFDLATPFFGNEYTFSQLNVPDSLKEKNIHITFLKAGHPSYWRPSAEKKMHEVMTKVIKSGTGN